MVAPQQAILSAKTEKTEESEALKNLAIKQVAKVKSLQGKVKTLNDQIKENLQKDQEYAKLSTDARNLSVGMKQARNRVMLFPENVNLERKKKDIQSELKDAKASLSATAYEWCRQTQLSLFEVNDVIYRVVNKAEVKVKDRKKSRRRLN